MRDGTAHGEGNRGRNEEGRLIRREGSGGQVRGERGSPGRLINEADDVKASGNANSLTWGMVVTVVVTANFYLRSGRQVCPYLWPRRKTENIRQAERDNWRGRSVV